MENYQSRYQVWIALLAAMSVQVLTWFALYPLAGYNDTTLIIAQVVFLALGAFLIALFKVGWDKIGLRAKDFVRALVGMAISYGLLLAILPLLNAFGQSIPVFRQEYSLYALANNWLLTGFGEELFFAGLLFNLIARSGPSGRRMKAVLLTASLFSLWHLPGYLAVVMKMGTFGPGMAFDLLLRMISWGFFGMIYLFSGNLWLTAFAHASTDYTLLPAVVNSPLLGLVFMGLNVLIAWMLGRLDRQTASRRWFSRNTAVKKAYKV